MDNEECKKIHKLQMDNEDYKKFESKPKPLFLRPSILVTCLADKTNHPVRRPKSQQIAVW